MNWIDTNEATLMRIKHGPDVCNLYQEYLDDPDIGYENAIGDFTSPFNFDDWFEWMEEQISWENSEEFQMLLGYDDE